MNVSKFYNLLNEDCGHTNNNYNAPVINVKTKIFRYFENNLHNIYYVDFYR